MGQIKDLISVITVLILLTGCIPGKNVGGNSRIYHPSGLNAGTQQPENPKASTSQTTESKNSVKMIIPAGSTFTIGTNTFSSSKPVIVEQQSEERTGTDIGASQEDLSSAFKNMRPVKIAGILLFLAGIAMFYPPIGTIINSRTLQIACIAGGLGAVFLAHAVVGHETLVIILLIGGPAVYFFIHRHGELKERSKK